MNLSPSLPGGWAAVGIPAVQIAVVVAVTAVAALRLRRAGWRRVVWQAGLVCVALLAVELVTGFGRKVYQRHRREARNAPPPVMEVVPVPVTAAPVDVSVPAITEEHVDNEAFDAPVTVNDAVPIADEMPAFEVPAETKQSLPLLIDTKPVVSVETEVTPMLPWWVLLVWVLGAVAVTARILAARWHLLRLGSAARDTLDTAVYERTQSLAGRLGMRRRVRVIETDQVHAPIVYGLLRPTLAVPARWTEDFDGRQREAMLAHELAHLAAHDPAWYLFTDVVTAMLWWHPAVWWARAQLHAASEIAADEASLLLANGPDTLAECLVQLARQWVEARRDAGIGVEGDGFRSRLGRRVERLLALEGQRWRPLSRARSFGVQAGVPLLLLVVILLTTGWMVPGWLATRGPSFQPVLDRLAVLTLVERPPQKTKLPVPSTKTDVAAADAAIPAASLKPTGDVRTNSTETTVEQKALETKLDQIVIQQIFYPTLPLPEVLKDLSRQVERADPDKRGLNIFVNRYLGVSDDPAKAGLWRLAGVWDPQTVFVRIEPLVKNLTLRQTLDRICRNTDQAVTWHLEDYGIEIVRNDLPLFKPAQNISSTVPVDEAQRQRLALLREMPVKSFFVPNLPLPEVIHDLRKRLSKNDATLGFKFRLRDRNGVEVPPGGAGEWDPQTVFVDIDPPLQDLRMTDVLDAVAKRCDSPVKVLFEGDTIVFQHNPAGGKAGAAYPLVDAFGNPLGPPPAVKQDDGAESPAAPAPIRKPLSPLKEVLEQRVGKIQFNKIPLSEAAKVVINQMQKSLTPEAKFELKFLDGQGVEAGRAKKGGWDPGSVLVAVDPPQLDLTFSEVLDAIVKGANAPIKLIIEGNQIIIQEVPVALRPDGQEGAGGPPAFGRQAGNRVLSADGLLPVPNPFLRTNVGNSTTVGRAAILAKLENIRFDEVHFPNVPFTEVLKKLDAEVRKKDPEGKGLNFILNPFLDNLPGAPGVAGGRPKLDFSTITVEIDPPLRDLRLLDVLQVVCRSASQPVKYVVEDYAVAFVPKGAEPAVPLTRIFKVDPSTFIQGLENVQGAPVPGTGNQNGNNAPTIPRVAPVPNGNGNGAPAPKGGRPSSSLAPPQSDKVRDYFAARGLDFSTNQAGRFVPQIMFNDQSGSMLVRAEPKDMTLIERELGSLGVMGTSLEPTQTPATMPWTSVAKDLRTPVADASQLGAPEAARPVKTNSAPPEVQIEARFVDLPVSKLAAAGLAPFTVAGLAGLRATNAQSVTVRPAMEGSQVLKAAQVVTVSAVLSAGQTGELLGRLERTKDVVITTSPSLQTRFGGEAQAAMQNIAAVVVGLSLVTNDTGRALVPQNKVFNFGPEIRVRPSLTPAGKGMQLDTKLSLTEFLGYDDPRLHAEEARAASALYGGIKGQVPLPVVREQRVQETYLLRDGQTLLIGGEALAGSEPKGKNREARRLFILMTAKNLKKEEAVQAGGTSPVAHAAQDEAARRAESVVEVRRRLAEAQIALKEKRHLEAAPQCELVLRLVERLGGVGVQSEKQVAIDGLTEARLAMAKEAFQRGDYDVATRQADLLLNFVPDSKAGKQFRQYNLDVQTASKGRRPSAELIAKIPEYLARKADTSQLVQDGKLLFEIRLVDEAEVRLKEALERDPDNKAAYYYLGLIQEARYADEARKRDQAQKTRLMEVEKEWTIDFSKGLPAPNLQASVRSATYKTDTNQFLGNIRRVLDAFAEKPAPEYGSGAEALIRQYFAHHRVKILTNDAPASWPVDLLHKPCAFIRYDERTGEMSVSATMPALEIVTAAIVLLDPKPNAVGSLNSGTNLGGLKLPNPYLRTNLPPIASVQRRIILAKLNDIKIDTLSYQKKPLPEVLKDLDRQAKEGDPTHKGISFIINRFMEDLPSATNRVGVSPVQTPANFPLTDAFGAPLAGTNPRTQADWNPQNVLITIDPAVHSLTLYQALEGICHGSAAPIKYTVEDYAIVFSQWSPEAPLLYTKIFKVDPTNVMAALERQAPALSNDAPDTSPSLRELDKQQGRASTNQITRVTPTLIGNDRLRLYLRAAGLDFGPPTSGISSGSGPALPQNPASAHPQIFFNDRNGTIMVRATMLDLEIIQGVIELLNSKPVAMEGELPFSRNFPPSSTPAPAKP